MTTSNAVDISDLYLDLHDSNDEGATVAVHGRRGADGVLAETLDGAAARAVVHAAEPLLTRLAQEGEGPVRALFIDFPAMTLRALCLRPGHVEDHLGRDFARALWRQRGGANHGEVAEVPAHLQVMVRSGLDFQHQAAALREVVRAAARALRPRPTVESPADAAAWEARYQAGHDGWELWSAAPPLSRFLAEHPLSSLQLGPAPRALVPGAGRGHEARLLARAGALVTAVDFATSAVAECRRLSEAEGLSMTVLEEDFFALPDRFAGAFDLLVEHTCYCAIPPARREDYARAAAALVRPGGLLLGLFFCHGDPGGPPYGATTAEIDARFAARFTALHQEVPGDSVPPRAGQEYLVLLRRDDHPV